MGDFFNILNRYQDSKNFFLIKKIFFFSFLIKKLEMTKFLKSFIMKVFRTNILIDIPVMFHCHSSTHSMVFTNEDNENAYLPHSDKKLLKSRLSSLVQLSSSKSLEKSRNPSFSRPKHSQDFIKKPASQSAFRTLQARKISFIKTRITKISEFHKEKKDNFDELLPN